MAAEGWQPIETAPKDGTLVLLDSPTWDVPCSGSWQMDRRMNAECWTDYHGGVFIEEYEPTHWLCLPPRRAHDNEKD
jgi:hypothetical protein